MEFYIATPTAQWATGNGDSVHIFLLHFHGMVNRKPCCGLFFLLLLSFGGKQMVLGEINICFSQFLSIEYWLFWKTPFTSTCGLMGSCKLPRAHFKVIKHPAVWEWLMGLAVSNYAVFSPKCQCWNLQCADSPLQVILFFLYYFLEFCLYW